MLSDWAPNSLLAWLRSTLELQDASHKRLLAMEGLRGLAVFLVFLQHFSYQALLLCRPGGIGEVVLTAFRSYGNLGVDLFFVLSGYLIYGRLVARQTDFMKFMRRRAQRIYPAFLVAFIIYLGAVLAGPTADRLPSDPYDLSWFLLSNLLLLPGLFPLPLLMAVAWSLSYEMFFYLVCGAVAARFELFSVAPAARITGIVVLTALFIVACALWNWVPARMLPFFVGMLIAEGIGVTIGPVQAWIGLSAAPIALVVSRTVPMPELLLQIMHSAAFFFLCASCFAGTFAATIFSWTPARLFGNMSYSYYLVHGLPVITLGSILYHILNTPVPEWMVFAALPFVFVISVVPAFLLFVFVERPFSLRPRLTVAMPRAAA